MASASIHRIRDAPQSALSNMLFGRRCLLTAVCQASMSSVSFAITLHAVACFFPNNPFHIQHLGVQLLCADLPPKRFDRLKPPLPSPGALRIPLFLAIMNGRTTTIASPANTKRTMSPCSMNTLMSLAACLTQDALITDYCVLTPMTVLMLVSGQVYCNRLSQPRPPPPSPLPPQKFPKSPLPRTPCSNGNAQGPQTASHAKQAGRMRAGAGHAQF